MSTLLNKISSGRLFGPGTHSIIIIEMGFHNYPKFKSELRLFNFFARFSFKSCLTYWYGTGKNIQRECGQNLQSIIKNG